jgi:hypothetical protein
MSLILLEIKKTNHWRNTDGLTDGEARQKKYFPGESTGKIIPFVFSTVITDGLSVGDCGMAVNISKLYQIPTDISVGNGNGNHRRNISVGNCGMGGNCLAPLGTILTAGLCLESRRYVFKIF